MFRPAFAETGTDLAAHPVVRVRDAVTAARAELRSCITKKAGGSPLPGTAALSAPKRCACEAVMLGAGMDLVLDRHLREYCFATAASCGSQAYITAS